MLSFIFYNTNCRYRIKEIGTAADITLLCEKFKCSVKLYRDYEIMF